MYSLYIKGKKLKMNAKSKCINTDVKIKQGKFPNEIIDQ